MLQMGENPISEEEFENFITVIIRFLVRFGVTYFIYWVMLYQRYFSVFQLTQKVSMTIKVLVPSYNHNNNTITVKDSVRDYANDAEDGLLHCRLPGLESTELASTE